MKKGLSRQAKVGIFGLSLAILLYLGINFIKSKKLFSNDNTFYAEYNSANGIEVSSPVIIKGFKVGTVDGISFDIKKSTVIVKMSVNGKYPIPDNSKAKIASASLLGGKVVEITLGNAATDYENGAYIIPEEEQGLLELASTEYEKLKGMATNLLSQVDNALSGINAVLSEANVKNLSGTLENLNSMSGNVNKLIASQRKNLETTISNLESMSTTLKNEMPKIGVTLDNLNSITTTLKTDAPNLIANAASAVDNLNKILAKINNSEGAIGKLVNEEEFYNNLNNVTSSLTALLADLKENPKRYINISVFGGGNKEKKNNEKK